MCFERSVKKCVLGNTLWVYVLKECHTKTCLHFLCILRQELGAVYRIEYILYNLLSRKTLAPGKKKHQPKSDSVAQSKKKRRGQDFSLKKCEQG